MWIMYILLLKMQIIKCFINLVPLSTNLFFFENFELGESSPSRPTWGSAWLVRLRSVTAGKLRGKICRSDVVVPLRIRKHFVYFCRQVDQKNKLWMKLFILPAVNQQESICLSGRLEQTCIHYWGLARSTCFGERGLEGKWPESQDAAERCE
jgi:hypothetical protein